MKPNTKHCHFRAKLSRTIRFVILNNYMTKISVSWGVSFALLLTFKNKPLDKYGGWIGFVVVVIIALKASLKIAKRYNKELKNLTIDWDTFSINFVENCLFITAAVLSLNVGANWLRLRNTACTCCVRDTILYCKVSYKWHFLKE